MKSGTFKSDISGTFVSDTSGTFGVIYSLYLLLEQGTFDVDTIKTLYNTLPEQIKNSLTGKFTADKIKEEENKKNSEESN